MHDDTGGHRFGWRDLLGAVNLRDFSQMVRGELAMVGSSFRLASDAFTRLPFGPFIAVAGLLLLLVRLVLLTLVIVVFGTGIVLISAVRAVSRMFSGVSEREP
ncbi:MAG: hypothetical protein WD939_07785 [Dehalococcoidia bacterium]